MDFVQELVLAVELSEVLGVAISVGEGELIVIPNFAEMTVKVLKTLLKERGITKGISKCKKLELVKLLEGEWVKLRAKKEVGKSKARKAGGARKRKQ